MKDVKSGTGTGTGIKYFVLARNQRQFIQWAKEKGKELTNCKLVEIVEDLVPIDFRLKWHELVRCSDWMEGRTKSSIEVGRTVINLYCRDRGVSADKIQTDYVI